MIKYNLIDFFFHNFNKKHLEYKLTITITLIFDIIQIFFLEQLNLYVLFHSYRIYLAMNILDFVFEENMNKIDDHFS